MSDSHIVKKARSFKREIFQVVLSVVIVVASAADMIGERARLVNILTIVAGSLGAGITLGVLIERRRRERG